MPELPDLVAYREALEERVRGERLAGWRSASPFLLRSVDPPPEAAVGRRLEGVSLLGKRLVWEFEGELFFVLHLMVAGRLRWREPGAALPVRGGQAALDWAAGTVLLTEAGKRRRASLYVVQGRAALAEHDPGGIDPLEVDAETFREALTRENHTLKRGLTDPHIFAGIGGAYGDEILHAAGLSPLQMTRNLDAAEIERLRDATRETLIAWIERHREERAGAFPEKVTAFHPAMAVHGKHGEPCPVCGDPVQRIVYASNETNYCATCQTDGKLLRDRALSALMRKDWPRNLEELERRKRQ